jgi:hypothetical protein
VVDAAENPELADVVASLEEPDLSEAHAVDAGTDAEFDPEIVALQADLDTHVPEVAPEVEAAQASEVGSDSAAVSSAGDEPGDAAQDVKALDAQAAAEDAKGIALPDDRAGVPIWPFAVYFMLWAVFAGLLVWQLLAAPAGTPIYEMSIYGISILVGLGLTVIGPLLAIVVWFAAWLARPGARAGLFSRSLIIGAVTTLAGVALWLIALGAVDMLRLGRLL